MKKVLLAFAFLLVAQIGSAQANSEFKKDVLKYIELSGVAATYEKLVDQFSQSIPAEKQAEFKKEIKTSINGLVDKTADLYMKELSHEDIKAAIKFYESPSGKKISALTQSDSFMEKAQSLGQEWGMSVQGIMMKYMQ
ncbi:DUF2059 domain-containing protein [Flavobacterium sp. MK4S-17]|jgi:hypothetical protein|uniref:DUF2059 domain-containing protein n=1 Tax=Flavobacterium sp. MK4S-17 TaxID=2543737 RepID=UPI0013572ADE|nr:DUF2059 domain-containing protein [Flavobacterium sp. MK4S-17]